MIYIPNRNTRGYWYLMQYSGYPCCKWLEVKSIVQKYQEAESKTKISLQFASENSFVKAYTI